MGGQIVVLQINSVGATENAGPENAGLKNDGLEFDGSEQRAVIYSSLFTENGSNYTVSAKQTITARLINVTTLLFYVCFNFLQF